MQFIVDHINKSLESKWILPQYKAPQLNARKDLLKAQLVPLKQDLLPIPSTFHELQQWVDKAKEPSKQHSAAPHHVAKPNGEQLHPFLQALLART